MASQLRQILDYFQSQQQPQSLQSVAHQLATTPEMMSEMVDYWVRKGKIRIVASNGHECTSCGVRGACPFVMQVPRYYEVVSANPASPTDAQQVSDACQIDTVCECGTSCSCRATR